MLPSIGRSRCGIGSEYPPPCGCGGGRGGGILCMPAWEAVDDMVWVRPSEYIEGGGTDEVIVCDRPGGGAAPKMLEKAASRWTSRWL